MVQNNHFGKYDEQTIPFAIPYDGRSDFASNPHNGSDPSYTQLLAQVCTAALQPGCIRREAPTGGAVIRPRLPHARPASGRGGRAAANRHFDGVRGRLRLSGLTRSPARPADQHLVQPGDGRKLPVQRHQSSAISGVGRRLASPSMATVRIATRCRRPSRAGSATTGKPLAPTHSRCLRMPIPHP